MLDIQSIRQECNVGNIKWTTHVLERMQERDIEPTDVINCISNGIIIEQYPTSYPHPACLILGTDNKNRPIHIVVGYGTDVVCIVTVYEPDEEEWTDNFKQRRKK